MDREGAQCDGKQQHATKGAAIRHKWALWRRYNESGLNVYRCVYCGYYHVGHDSPSGARRRRHIRY